MRIEPPYLLFLGDAPDRLAVKTADGLAHWRPRWCLGQLRLPGCKVDLGLPEMTLEQGREAGAKTLIVGAANRGGVISPPWIHTLLGALDLGFDIASGLHQRLSAIPALGDKAAARGSKLFDVRHPSGEFPIANGGQRTGKRLLTVGTDCSIGKMFTALALEREMKARGMKADFRATGQTGIFIAGEGVSVDAVVADFVAGAVEDLTPGAEPDHWDLIEGQGSLFHPSYAGVSLGLLHGAQADRLVMCHDLQRRHMRGLPAYPLPPLQECIRRNEEAGRLTNEDCRVAGVAVITAHLSSEKASELLEDIEAETGLPAVDPCRGGVGRLVDAL